MIVRTKVVESRALTPSCHGIRLKKPAGFAFRPVQFCGLEISTADGSEEYPMSLACSPTRGHLEFGARVTSGSPWKRAFAALRPGDEVEVDGPYGHFVLDEARDALFVAGGIGITPLKGMLEYLTDVRSPRRAILVFSNQSEAEIVYRAELDALARANPRIEVLHTLTREPEDGGWPGRRGRIDATLLREVSARLDDPTWYVCGGRAMVQAGVEMAMGQGVPAERVVYELFPGYG